MPQALLPIIPPGATAINDVVSVVFEQQQWTYFCGIQPVFRHPMDDSRSFRMFSAQLCVQGTCSQAEILRTFGVSKHSVLRSVAKYRQLGIGAFYSPRKGRGPSIMTPEIICQAQELLSGGSRRKDVAGELKVKYDTLRKAIEKGRLQEPSVPIEEGGNPATGATDKSTRSEMDGSAAKQMGMGCTGPAERVFAASDRLPDGASTQFQLCRDVSYGGVLCALPALGENGLFGHLDSLPLLSGYYRKVHIVILLAYMALCRIKAVEQLQYESPGELGKLMGLDRTPEVRCLRKKLSDLSQLKAPEGWAAALSKEWMEHSPQSTGTLYVDGHVRVYHGKQTKLPRRYIARQRLCLRGTTDYWVNDALGQPFFSVERPIDHGLLEALDNDIVPRLLKDVPAQPTAEELKGDPHLSRFVMIFDREGYSPAFFARMWKEHRIGCITYHKYAKDPWPQSWFSPTEVRMPGGELVSMKLAEMGSRIGSRRDGLWVREVRKLTNSGHQTSLISTVYGELAIENAARLFSRWSQENFFGYMMEHFAIDALNEYRTEVIADTNRPVVNPARRELERHYRSSTTKLNRCQVRFTDLTLHPETKVPEIKKWQRKKADLREQIEHLEKELNVLKEKKLAVPKHLAWADLPEAEKFERLAPSRKRLTDTVKLVAYRAETAMATIVRDKLSHEGEARSLIRDLLKSDADLYPDETAQLMKIRVHTMANPRSNRAIQHLLEHLNAAKFTYPGTKLRLVYTLADSAQE